MIVGLGSDLCDMRRIARVAERFGERFLTRSFTVEERRRAERRYGDARIGTYAKRWAAKEACVKALGTGFAHGVFLQDIGVVNRPGGAPTLELRGGAHAALMRLVPEGCTPLIHVSLTDELPYAMAYVIIEAISRSG